MPLGPLLLSWWCHGFPSATLRPGGSYISHYTISYFPQTSGGKRQSLALITKTVPGMDANNAAIESLDPNTPYHVRVSATNGAETSDPSTVAIAILFIGMYDMTVQWYQLYIVAECVQFGRTAAQPTLVLINREQNVAYLDG